MTAGYEEDEVYYEKVRDQKRKEAERQRQEKIENGENPNVHDGYDYSKGERVSPSKSGGGW